MSPILDCNLLLVLMPYSMVKSLGMSESLLTFHHHPLSSSARVMRNESGESRGFGFVSFQTPDQGSVETFSPDYRLLKR